MIFAPMNPPAPPRRPRPWVGLTSLVLLALFVVTNLQWVRRHPLAAPPAWDQSLYLFLSLRYRHAWEEGGPPALLRELRTRAEPQPPLLPLTALPFYAALGDGRLSAYAASSFYGCLLLVAIAWLARRRAGDAGALLALVMAGGFSAPLLLSRDYQMDLPAAALLSAAVVAIECSDGFRRGAASVLAGLLAGLMVLAKTMAAPFLVAPALHALARSWRTEDRRRVARHVAVASAVAAAVASVWWGPHLTSVLRYLLYYGWGDGAAAYDPTGGASLLSLRNLGYYVVAFANEGASVPFFAIALALLVVEARRFWRAAPRPALDGLLWTWLLAAYALLTIARNKASDRYLIFLIPPVVVLMSTALLRQGARWRRLGVAAVALAGTANYAAHTWPASGVRLLKWRPPFGLEAYVPRKTWLRTMSHVPDGDWPIGPIVTALGAARVAYHDPLRQALAERALAAGSAAPEEQVQRAFRALLRRDPDPEALRKAAAGMRGATLSLPGEVAVLAASPEAARRSLRVLVLPDHPYVNASTLRYQAEWSRAPVTFARIEPGQSAPELEDFDAVVVKTGVQGPDLSTTQVGLVQDQLGRSRFRLLPAVFHCPDGSQVRIFFLAAPV